MSLLASALHLAERTPLPDLVTRAGIAGLVRRTRRLPSPDGSEVRFAQAMDRFPIAEHPQAANRQHYELPPEFFALALGPRRKYSCCLYKAGGDTLADAELAALEETALHAGLADGQRILELGCGWGSLTLFMAERYPQAHLTAVSNSHAQGQYIARTARARGLANVELVTADMNGYTPGGQFDRIVSVEMFEHIANWRALLARARTWLRADGRLFLHVFTHRDRPYRFDVADPTDWIAQHFFTGGIMPSHGLIRHFPDLFEVEQDWRWNGRHYRRTALDWLANFDSRPEEIGRLLEATYGVDAALWRRRWRLFFLATAGLFGDSDGTEWGVSHYLLRPAGR